MAVGTSWLLGDSSVSDSAPVVQLSNSWKPFPFKMPFVREMEETVERGKKVKLMSSKFSKNKMAQEAVRHPDEIRDRNKKKDGFDDEEVRTSRGRRRSKSRRKQFTNNPSGPRQAAEESKDGR